MMPAAFDIQDTVHQDFTATLLNRVTGWGGVAIGQSDVSAITYSIFLLDDHDPDSRVAVAGYQDVVLAKADVVYDALQTGVPWTKDSTGYNFRHTPPRATGGVSAFGQAGRKYLVEYTITPTSGEAYTLRFRLSCI